MPERETEFSRGRVMRCTLKCHNGSTRFTPFFKRGSGPFRINRVTLIRAVLKALPIYRDLNTVRLTLREAPAKVARVVLALEVNGALVAVRDAGNPLSLRAEVGPVVHAGAHDGSLGASADTSDGVFRLFREHGRCDEKQSDQPNFHATSKRRKLIHCEGRGYRDAAVFL